MSKPTASRITFERFSTADAPGLAKVLSDPEVTRSIMANATTPERCLDCAKKRIEWHNSTWDTHGYGVWGLKPVSKGSTGSIIGWCGLISTSHGENPEILYGLSRDNWGTGLATEAARSTIEWAFRNRICDGIDAVIFGHLNPGSAAVARKLGMRFAETMTFSDFLPDDGFGREVLGYEVWRLGHGAFLDFDSLLFQAPFKAGLIVSAGVADPHETQASLIDAALSRDDRPAMTEDKIRRKVKHSFEKALKEPELDVYRIVRDEWSGDRRVNDPDLPGKD